ncbi:hypothetical protein ACO0QE_003602 [Hanseniaspora vineae]
MRRVEVNEVTANNKSNINNNPNEIDFSKNASHTKYRARKSQKSDCSKNMGLPDFNVYYKDITEDNEPFVSLGLLSNLQSVKTPIDDPVANSTTKYYNEIFQDPNCPLVFGRICTNFSSFIRANGNASGNAYTNDILEIKLRFSRAQGTLGKGHISNYNASHPTAYSTNTAPIKTTSTTRRNSSNAVKPVPVRKTKRVTNPRPAPKATKTQSLPIWNNSMMNPAMTNSANNTNSTGYSTGNSTGNGVAQRRMLPSTSIIKKIQQGDQRNMGELNNGEMQSSPNYQDSVMTNYSGSNFVTTDSTPVAVDVSKRFEFASKLKSSNNSNGNSAVKLYGNTSSSSPLSNATMPRKKKTIVKDSSSTSKKKKKRTIKNAQVKPSPSTQQVNLDFSTADFFPTENTHANNFNKIMMLEKEDEENAEEEEEMDIKTNIIDNPESKDHYSPTYRNFTENADVKMINTVLDGLPILEEENHQDILDMDMNLLKQHTDHVMPQGKKQTKKRTLANASANNKKRQRLNSAEPMPTMHELVAMDKENIIPMENNQPITTTTGLVLPDITIDDFFSNHLYPTLPQQDEPKTGNHNINTSTHPNHQEVLDIALDDEDEEEDEDEDDEEEEEEGNENGAASKVQQEQWFNDFLHAEYASGNAVPEYDHDHTTNENDNTPKIPTPSTTTNQAQRDEDSKNPQELYSSLSSSSLSHDYMDDYTSTTSTTNADALVAENLCSNTPLQQFATATNIKAPGSSKKFGKPLDGYAFPSRISTNKHTKIMPSSPPTASNKNDDHSDGEEAFHRDRGALMASASSTPGHLNTTEAIHW